jgi:predicted enzyme related to lactoylglutathione lyase
MTPASTPGIDASEGRTEKPLAVIRTEDLELAEREVLAAGGEITRPAFDFPGGRRFHFREPGGNELAVWIEKALATPQGMCRAFAAESAPPGSPR